MPAEVTTSNQIMSSPNPRVESNGGCGLTMSVMITAKMSSRSEPISNATVRESRQSYERQMNTEVTSSSAAKYPPAPTPM
eukprot:scaffold6029_cov63-Phaeocystis_antarctica.AAC.2